MTLFRPTFKLAAFVMVLWGIAMLPCALVDLPDWKAGLPFLEGALICFLVAALLFRSSSGHISHLQSRALFMATACSWVISCLACALPYLLAEDEFSFTDSVFEAVSGMTTTGATIVTDIESLSHGILIWRSITQWMGGIGIILVAVAVLPSLKTGGMKLFRSEFSDWNQLETGRINKIAFSIISIYLLISGLCLVAYIATGMPWFDAINHMMTTVSTGGFSTWNASFGHYNDNHQKFVASIFMLIGAFPFLLVVISFRDRSFRLFRDWQVRHLLLMCFGSALIIALWRYFVAGEESFLILAESSLFNVVSIATTTGYASEDYTLWGSFPVIIFCFLMFSGGCSGSTSGGIKLFRYHLLFIFTRESIKRALHPEGIVSRQYNQRPLREDILVSSLAFFFFVIVALGISTALLSASGLDPVTSLSGALTALMNVGPGLGDTIGPAGNFSSVPAFAKYVLCVDMLLGRLEYLTLVVIFTRAYWKW